MLTFKTAVIQSVVAKSLAGCFAFGLIASVALAAEVKDYQVTGKLVEVTDKKLVVDKGDEKWEIERSGDLKVDGKLEVGQKVTIYYHMIADKAVKK